VFVSGLLNIKADPSNQNLTVLTMYSPEKMVNKRDWFYKHIKRSLRERLSFMSLKADEIVMRKRWPEGDASRMGLPAYFKNDPKKIHPQLSSSERKKKKKKHKNQATNNAKKHGQHAFLQKERPPPP
jgi:hypothetical protein